MIENQIGDAKRPEGQVATGPLTQFSLFEMFFVTTLCGLAIGVYVFVSPLVVAFAGGWLVVLGILHVLKPGNLLAGGLLGFAATSLVTAFIMWTIDFDHNAIPIAAMLPAVGYFYGACKAEFRDDSI